MITIKQVPLYVTQDGQEFLSLVDAEKIELEFQIAAWVSRRLCRYDNSAADIIAAIVEDREGLIEALQLPALQLPEVPRE